MKKTEVKFELTEDDITEAIKFWLNACHADNADHVDFEVDFSIEEKVINDLGGMGGYCTKAVTTAVATKL